MNKKQLKNIKIGLAILFFLCLIDMPYGFYQFVRFAAMVGFGLLAYQANVSGERQLAIIYLALLILFQPLLKIPLGRTLWNIVDVVVGVWLVLDVLGKKIKIQ